MSRFGRVKVKTAPTVEPLTVAEAKIHLRVDHADDDATIERQIVAVRQLAEKFLRRSLCTQTLQLHLDEFPCHELVLPRGPAASIASITYVDTAGVTQTLASYQSDLVSEPARLFPAYGESWPSTRDVPNAVIVEYVAGYGAAAAVPEQIRAGMLLALSDLFENRGSVVIGTISAEIKATAAERLWWPYRLLEQP